jgi:ferric-dicitrate binding protein FerR (iron transport regulator)
MIVLLEEPEAWSLMMLVSAVAMDNADISNEARDAIRHWRGERPENSPEMEKLTEAINQALNAHLDTKFMRRVKNRGWYETVRK